MTSLNGIFFLRTPMDLLQKLEADYHRLKALNPDSIEANYSAFDFFVTAEHLPDWIKHTSGGSISSHRKYPDGALVSHIASGAKHFHVQDSRHTTVSDTDVFGCFDPAAFCASAFDVRRLVILLENGNREDVLDVAERIVLHWREILLRE